MEFLVPWRLLFPSDLFDVMCRDGGGVVKEIACKSGARIDVASAVPVPHVCSTKLVTIHGTMWQKRTAGRQLVDKLFELQGMDLSRWWTWSGRLSVIFPAVSRNTVMSTTVKDSVGVIGASMCLDAACSEDDACSRFVVHFEGNSQQVISAITRVNTSLQDLADHDQVKAADFSEVESPSPPSIAESVRAARLAPAGGVARPAPHTHPAMMPSTCGPQQPGAEEPSITATTEAKCQNAAMPSSVPSDWTPPLSAAAPTCFCNNGFCGNLFESPNHKLINSNFSGGLDPLLGDLQSQQIVLLPIKIVSDFLLPGGHLRDIAQKCSVHIKIEPELQTGGCILVMTGTVLANTIATLHLQWKAQSAPCSK